MSDTVIAHHTRKISCHCDVPAMAVTVEVDNCGLPFTHHDKDFEIKTNL